MYQCFTPAKSQRERLAQGWETNMADQRKAPFGLAAHAGDTKLQIQFFTVSLRGTMGERGEIVAAEIEAQPGDALA